ncbi:MAG TPA: hypothetical protein VKT28_22685 [Puia sp.]|nr:hypothetical protein [Puia sp.]
MHSYKVKIIKPVIFVLLIIFFIGFAQYFLDSFLINFSSNLRTFLFIIFYVLSIIISYRLSTIKLLIKLNDKEIAINKISGILPYQSKSILLKDISGYQLSDDLNYYNLKIRLKNNVLIRLTKFKDSQDDFQKFSNKFIQIVRILNENEEGSVKRIPNLYETKTGFIITIFFVLMAVLILVFGKGSTRIYAAIPGLMFFIRQVYNYRKDK